MVLFFIRLYSWLAFVCVSYSYRYDIKQKLHIVSQGEEHIARLELKLRETKSMNDKVTREYNGLADKVQRLQRELEEQKHLNSNTRLEINQKQSTIRLREEEISVLKSEINKINRARETANHKLRNIERTKVEAEKQREMLKNELQTTEKDIETLRVSLDSEHKKLDELLRERDLLNKLKTQAENATQKQIDLVAINENTRKNLEQELQAYKVEAQRQNKLIDQLKKEREKYVHESLFLRQTSESQQRGTFSFPLLLRRRLLSQSSLSDAPHFLERPTMRSSQHTHTHKKKKKKRRNGASK